MRSSRFIARPVRLVVLAAVAQAAVAQAAVAQAGEIHVVDRIVAVVDEVPIFHSDLRRAIELGLVRGREADDGRALERRALDELIDQRLRLREVERFGTRRIEAAEIERQVDALRDRFGGEAGLAAELADLGLDDEGLRHLVSQQLRVLRYVDERLGPRIFVDLEEIRAYYEAELTPELDRRGIPVPALEEVREGVRMLLRERRLNREIDTWTRELRLEADVVDYFDRELEDDLPPVVQSIE